MLKTFKFKGDEQKYFWISDLHRSHAKEFLFGRRGFTSIEDHDRNIVNEWNKTCDSSSTIFNLGDIQFHDSDGSKFLEFNRQVNFKEHYVAQGNHNSGYRQNYLKELKEQFPNAFNNLNELQFEVYPLVKILDGYKKIIFMPVYFEVFINSQFIVNCHYPIISHNQQSKSAIMCCGHSHQNCKVTNINTGQGLRIDCSLEGFKRPWNLTEIKYHLRNRNLDSVDHHSSTTT